jgi:hypothetical protein
MKVLVINTGGNQIKALGTGHHTHLPKHELSRLNENKT